MPAIWLVDSLLLTASFLISCATTANPLPESPALSASMDAFKANRLVWRATSLITPITCVMFWMLSLKFCISLTRRSVCSCELSQLVLTSVIVAMFCWFKEAVCVETLSNTSTSFASSLAILESSFICSSPWTVSRAWFSVTLATSVIVCDTSSTALAVCSEVSRSFSAFLAVLTALDFTLSVNAEIASIISL